MRLISLLSLVQGNRGVIPLLRPIPLAARYKAWVCDRSLSGFAGSYPVMGMGGLSLSCECCVLLGRGLCEGPITRPEESYLPSVLFQSMIVKAR